MRILEKEKFNMLIAEGGKILIDKEDTEIKEKYYFKQAYIPKTFTIQECENKFIEIEEEKED